MTPAPQADLPLAISLESSTPLYDQIESQLRHLIVSGVLPASFVLPSVRALATSLGCSVITTRRAYQELEQQGLIRTLQGRGTMVADVPEHVREQHRLAPIEQELRHAVREARSAGISNAELIQILESILAEEEHA